MPATEYQGSSFLSRSIQSIRRNQVASVLMEGKQEQELQHVDIFLKHVGERFQDLFSFFSGDGEGDDENHSHHHHHHLLLNLPWLRKLLDAFLCCEEEFKAILLLYPKASFFSTRLLSDLLDRSLKALDLCNAISIALDSLRRSHDLANLALSALRQHPLGPGQFRRAGKALKTILTTITDKDPTATAERSWSFGRKSKSGHLQSSVSSTWSAAKQLQAIAGSLAPPRGAEMNGPALSIYTRSSVLVFVMWVLVAAVPCQDRVGLMTHLPSPPRQLPWAGAMIGLQERIGEEWRKKEKRGTSGLMEELLRLETCANKLIELGESMQFPMDAEKAEELRAQTNELAEICKSMEDELVAFQRQVREVFHRIAGSRTEVLDYMSQATRTSSTAVL
ncbi:Protein BYPASS-related [Cinnamomum micranthum f. kanehirae]|uniref:Protein BYPASS-related n=1 Tax=Cinnamomum micranthum f. kanehirae TaxID=337451 RepID=A0A443NQX8_9MAGN|nr:Protein BYPASS-related [Cinnamomum micranthum f. kanehirae]